MSWWNNNNDTLSQAVWRHPEGTWGSFPTQAGIHSAACGLCTRSPCCSSNLPKEGAVSLASPQWRACQADSPGFCLWDHSSWPACEHQAIQKRHVSANKPQLHFSHLLKKLVPTKLTSCSSSSRSLRVWRPCRILSHLPNGAEQVLLGMFCYHSASASSSLKWAQGHRPSFFHWVVKRANCAWKGT